MILDSRNEFCDASSLSTAGTGRALVGNVIDLGGGVKNIGIGQPPLYLVLIVQTTATSGGSATVSFELASDAQAAIATDGTATVHVASAAIAVATLVAGYRVFAIALPQTGTYERYLGILQNVGTAALTAGKIDAFLTEDVQNYVLYPDAI